MQSRKLYTAGLGVALAALTFAATSPAQAGSKGRRNTAAALGAAAAFEAIRGHGTNALILGAGAVGAYGRYRDARDREEDRYRRYDRRYDRYDRGRYDRYDRYDRYERSRDRQDRDRYYRSDRSDRYDRSGRYDRYDSRDARRGSPQRHRERDYRGGGYYLERR